MKYIFLDIDGVLNRNATAEVAPSGCAFVDNKLVSRLQHIFYTTHARIVLSSSWRMGWYDIAAGRVDTVAAEDFSALEYRLMSSGIPLHGYTPVIYDSSRAEEIRRYIKEEGDEVEGFIILDDIKIEGFEDRQIKTNPRTGLTDADVKRAIEMLME